MSRYKYATIDIETTGLNRFKDDITWVGVGFAEGLDTDVKVKTFDFSKPDGVKGFLSAVDYMKQNKLKTVFQNGKFDTLFLEVKLGIKLPISEDIMLMGTAYDLSAEHGLKKMAVKYLGVDDWDIPKKEKLNGQSKSIRHYLRCDVRYTWQVFQYFMEHMDEQQFKVYRKLLRPAYLMYRDVERNGAYVDIPALHQCQEKYKTIEAECLAGLDARYKINWNSSGQVADVLFEKEGLPVIKKSKKTGKPSADAAVLKRLASQGHELPQLILDYKAANTLNKMFLNRWEDDLGPDKRIHPSFNLTNVVSGRTSCQNPNLQQVPRTKDVRAIYKAPPGRLFFEADYSQLELRIAADYANDPTMLDIYRNNGDIHTTTAKLMTGGREPTKEERGKAKAVNFGFLYGMMAKKFVDYAYNSYGVIFTLAEATEFREKFFAKYARLLPWHHEQELICEAMGGVANKFGRFRKLPLIYSSNKWERASAARRAINTPVQGTGSDLLISAATQVHKELKGEGLKIIGTVHDSILGEFPEECKDWIVPEIRRIMLHPATMDEFRVELKVPLDCDIGVGPWGTH
jgi:DNA polymerase-1